MDFNRKRENPTLSICKAAIKNICSTTNLKTHLERWHGAIYADQEQYVDASTASINKKMQDIDKDIKHFFQLQLKNNSVRSQVIPAYYDSVENHNFCDMTNASKSKYFLNDIFSYFSL